MSISAPKSQSEHNGQAIDHQGDFIWQSIRQETQQQAQKEPILASFLHATILNHESLECSLSYHLANKLESPEASALLIREVIHQALRDDASIGAAMRADIAAVKHRDSACDSLSIPFLYYKGFHALQAFRVANWLWRHDRKALALFFQNRISVVFSVDIHPAATIGQGIMLDHATGIVIGETAVVEDNVSIMQAVTLGGTGKVSGDRHPKVRAGVLISAGAKIIGNIEIGEGSKVGAGSVVLKDVAPHTTVAGVPAKVVGCPDSEQPALNMNHNLNCNLDDI
ncbi:MAG: serine O-acetyltransferase [Cellvibrionaceae bacterium]|uniref:serine O-acetyltransferase n=1 Tax=uncultured Pseudoteredinibacter sp. TaxID=1641701 RepID=UPI0026106C4A|nr:serine O-acetyltransferase [uncultured Pseudoteredinibacter sp.]MCV6621408.1 serine O-acetyltransferase [Cellvibrionaceae bacterium]